MLPVVYHPDYSIVWSEKHRFPMTKFAMLHRYLLDEKIILPEQIHEPRPVSLETLALAHDREYLHRFMEGGLDDKAIRRIGMGWGTDLVRRTRAEAGGTVKTVKLALRHGLACNTAGGTHHAFPDFGSGFCFLNDVAVAAAWFLAGRPDKRVLIVDLDVHQGDGTAYIFRNEPRVFTFSMHGQRNFPFRKQASDLDIGLPDGTDDEAYMAELSAALPELLDRFQPDLAIYDAGVDPHVNDRLGKLALTDQGLYRRDAYVLRACRARDIPTACVIGGGYAENRDDLPPRHATLHRAATAVHAEYAP